MKYRIYVDEVGNSDLGASDDPNHRFLSLTGVIAELSYVQTVIHPQLEAIKQKFFTSHPDDPVLFHRKEMVNARPPFQVLKDGDVRGAFDDSLIHLLSGWNFHVISICLDKKRHKETYATWRYDPYHFCLAVLLERYVFFLSQTGATGDVMAESRGGRADLRLKASFTKLWMEGTQYVEPTRFQDRLTSKQLKVKNKQNNIAGLQLADLVAHPSRNEILIENDMLSRPLAPFAVRVVQVLQEKYYQVGGRMYGKKFL